MLLRGVGCGEGHPPPELHRAVLPPAGLLTRLASPLPHCHHLPLRRHANANGEREKRARARFSTDGRSLAPYPLALTRPSLARSLAAGSRSNPLGPDRRANLRNPSQAGRLLTMAFFRKPVNVVTLLCVGRPRRSHSGARPRAIPSERAPEASDRAAPPVTCFPPLATTRNRPPRTRRSACSSRPRASTSGPIPGRRSLSSK
jgi:hypothetical protein